MYSIVCIDENCQAAIFFKGERKKLLKNCFFSIIKPVLSVIYSVITLFSNIVYFLGILSRALTLRSL